MTKLLLIKKLNLLVICMLFVQSSYAINWEKVPNISIGPEVGFKTLAVIDIDSSDDQIARMSKGLSIVPSLVISSNEKYVWEDENWGYHVQAKGGWYNLDKQQIGEKTEELGTSIKGVSLFVVPVGYYHFNKNVTDNWTYKLGLGVGLGWVNIEGDVQITKNKHESKGEIIDVDQSGFGPAIGVYFEANYQNHSVVLQNYAPQIHDDNYFYQQQNVVIAYRYQIEKQWFKSILEK